MYGVQVTLAMLIERLKKVTGDVNCHQKEEYIPLKRYKHLELTVGTLLESDPTL